MQGTFHIWIKAVRRYSALALVLALLVPTLVAALPTPAFSAEQQLLADLGQNICGHGQSGDQDKGLPADHSQCCVLCGMSHHVFVPQSSVVVAEPQLVVATFSSTPIVIALLHAPPDMRATAPRGPPAV